MIVWTPAVLSVLYTCVLYFFVCPCSAHLSMFHVERRSRNTFIIIITSFACLSPQPVWCGVVWYRTLRLNKRIRIGSGYVSQC